MPDTLTPGSSPPTVVQITTDPTPRLQVTAGVPATIDLTEQVTVLEVTAPPAPLVEVTEQVTQLLEVVERGPQGPAGSGGQVHQQPAAASVWIIAHTFERYPTVACFDAAGVRIFPDEHASTTSVTLIFATPTAGTAVLT